MKYLFYLLLVLILFFRYQQTKPDFKEGQKLRITSTVLQEPVRYSTYQKLNVAGLSAGVSLYPEINYGDKIVIEGKVKEGKLSSAKVTNITKSGNRLFTVRKKMIEFFQHSLPEPHAALVAGIALGSKSSLPEKFWMDLRETGTAHVVVASGMNVAFVAAFLLAIVLIYLPRRKAIFLVAAGIWIYALLSGLEPPILRASIMASLVFLVQEMGKVITPKRALFYSAYLMLLVNPRYLSDLGFILSFTATLSLMLFNKRVSLLCKRLPRLIREDFSTSLSAQIGVAPILFISFGSVSWYSPLVNMLVLWTVAPITIAGIASALVGLIMPKVGQIILYLIYPLTWWFISVVEFCSKIF